LAKIAVGLQLALERRQKLGTPGSTSAHIVARGHGWTAADVVCTSGPRDRSFEERHTHYTIAVVLAGTFQYRAQVGCGLMTPGSLMLGNRGQCYECGHEHGEGDRCVSFWYAADYFERLAADAGRRGLVVDFTVPRLPPLRPLSAIVARAAAGVIAPRAVPWEELAVGLAAQAVSLAAGVSCATRPAPLNAEARVTRTIRTIDRHPDAALTLGALARDAGLSPYHFLRTFEHLTGVTPHQYVLRARLREAAVRLAADPGRILDIALDCGFADVSNFNRAFRTEFGLSPRAYRNASGFHLQAEDVRDRPAKAGSHEAGSHEAGSTTDAE
jgi:AraC family transcriptional regulator